MAQKVYDVVVVGAGAGGGTIAAHLARAGADVAIVEGGPRINTRTDFNTHAMPYEFPGRQIPTMKPGKQGMDTERSRGVGGKTMLWNAVAWRFSERDFRGKDHDDGAGANWPIHYADLAPYYDKIEREVGVCGNLDGLKDLPDGIFLPPAPMKCSDLIVKRGAAKLGVKVIHVRKSTRTVAGGGRPACHYCGNCMAGCDVAAKYNSADVHIYPAARATGKLEVVPNAVVYEVMLSDENKATGVRYIHRETKEQGEVRGKSVVLACACVQTVALMLMSKSSRYPTGIANSSGHLGKDFIPHFTGGVECFLPELMGKPLTPGDDGFLDHAYVPSFLHDKKDRGFARSFGMQFNYQNRRSTGWARAMPGFGKAYKESIKHRYPAHMVFSPYGEMLPGPRTFIDLDPTQKDKWGLPAARRTITHEENDKRIFKAMTQWSVDILKASGAEILRTWAEPVRNHELGGARMGDDPRDSVTNKWGQTHDVKNLFLADGAVFATASEKNPTHTIMALAARTADHIADRLRTGDL